MACLFSQTFFTFNFETCIKFVGTGESCCPLHASLVLSLLVLDVVKTINAGVLVNTAVVGKHSQTPGD